MSIKIKIVTMKDIKYISNVIAREIAKRNPLDKKILKSTNKNISYKDIASSFNVSMFYILKTVNEVAGEVGNKKRVDEVFQEISKESYINVSKLFPNYVKIVEKLFVLKHHKKQRYEYTVNHSMIDARSHKILKEYLHEDGFPLDTDHYGICNAYVDRTTFLLETDKETTWLKNNENKIIGDSKLSFLQNLEFWQIKEPFSLWSLYELYQVAAKEYLIEKKINTFGKFTNMLRRDNYLSKKRCELILLDRRCEDGSPIYELKTYIFVKSDKFFQKIETIKKISLPK